ncbi:hypothetical protein GCU56_19490 [Geodermatophilus sabuli]|uniref:DUF4386 family protein n=1 Tax=Geodermatophilus sabuli TaxID=1564158 RepID=A0A7K3W6N8_9ACTN|nr:hypothetical protein [Geodermatophilus sabuli]NEK60043.1 hypothetical protein [Geodermatophilus sabuli]
MDVRSGSAVGAPPVVDDGRRARTWDLVAAAAGLLLIAFFVASFFTPGTPSAENAGDVIASELTADRSGHQFSLFLGFLADVAFLVFLAGVWSRLRRGEGPGGMFAGLFAIAGAAFAALLMVSEGFYVALVQAAATDAVDSGEALDPSAFPPLAVLNDWAGSAVVPAGVAMFLGAAGAVLATRALPAWLGWLAALTAVVLLVSLAGVFEDPSEDGVLGIAGFIGFLLFLVWVLAASVALLLKAGRGPETAR